jgi:hypothetical protein
MRKRISFKDALSLISVIKSEIEKWKQLNK